MNLWYKQLKKPSWAPPSWIFGPVWTILYVVIIATFGTVTYRFFKKKISGRVLVPFGLNVLFNLAFTPVQFKLRNNKLALLDIFLVLFTLLWAMFAIYPFASWIALVNIPYLIWVSFATALQTNITWLNRLTKE